MPISATDSRVNSSIDGCYIAQFHLRKIGNNHLIFLGLILDKRKKVVYNNNELLDF